MGNEQQESYSRDELTLDKGSATITDGRLWIEGKTHDGRDITAGYELRRVPDDAEIVDDVAVSPYGYTKVNTMTAEVEWELAALHDVQSGEELGVR